MKKRVLAGVVFSFLYGVLFILLYTDIVFQIGKYQDLPRKVPLFIISLPTSYAVLKITQDLPNFYKGIDIPGASILTAGLLQYFVIGFLLTLIIQKIANRCGYPKDAATDA